ncbi:MAG: bifunctional demethylmenaquinone methyltransferase/2-methoxy-6-polyprenyl-1,4-benzoquinol methylase UbiE [Alphaproteobacteria bacterium]|nr:bifunctional demethylmenaquinone methyltransferase/2-methoxy-6-polyprenyl-1,4-benzoquinol methylase UbiE [Alphaproteobacteria bacterium]MBF0128998.1 bifunctional demethylmenaquinone methyltransferase/2-methoxy-6-polyprenyl-1,4-benzoquinol methylase UbiE [Alphaproteobacteria bacterium]
MDNTRDSSPETTHFGFRTVPAEEKVSMVNAVFDSVASRYDLMNDLMSGGIHRLWKARFIDWIDPRPGMLLLDVAGGTGDIAFRFLDRQAAKAAKLAGADGSPEVGALGGVTICDLNAGMLEVGRNRAIDQGRVAGLEWVCGDAEALPFPDRSFDVYTIAFGLRNVTRIDAALKEAHRVLKPGGRFMCLEFSRVVLPVLRELYDRYSFAVLPRMGRIVAGDGDAYQYLVESIRRFPPQEELSRRIAAAGLSQAKHRNLSGGIAAMHSAWRT